MTQRVAPGESCQSSLFPTFLQSRAHLPVFRPGLPDLGPREREVRGCAGAVQIWADGRVLKEYPRHTAERLLIDLDCFEGEATDRVSPPPPLGRMGRKLQEIYEMPVEARPLDLYAALAEVAR